MRKISVLEYDAYKQKHPASTMTKQEYEKKYESELGPGKELPKQAPASSVKDWKAQHSEEYKPPVEKPLPPVNPQKADKHKSFKALVDFAVNQGRVNTSHEASQLIRHLGYDEKDFGNHLIENLGNGVDFKDIQHFEDIGLFPKSFVARGIKNRMKENSVPQKFHADYGIKSASKTAGALDGLTPTRAKETLHNIIEHHTKGVFSDNHWKPIHDIESAIHRHGIECNLTEAKYFHHPGSKNTMPDGKSWSYQIPVSDKGGLWLHIIASFGPSSIETPAEAKGRPQESKNDRYDIVYQLEWTAKAKKTAVSSSIAQLEKKLAVADYQTYKKEHPGTEKTPSDPMFEHMKQKAESDPYYHHKYMAGYHEGKEKEHRARGEDLFSSSDPALFRKSKKHYIAAEAQAKKSEEHANHAHRLHDLKKHGGWNDEIPTAAAAKAYGEHAEKNNPHFSWQATPPPSKRF